MSTTRPYEEKSCSPPPARSTGLIVLAVGGRPAARAAAVAGRNWGTVSPAAAARSEAGTPGTDPWQQHLDRRHGLSWAGHLNDTGGSTGGLHHGGPDDERSGVGTRGTDRGVAGAGGDEHYRFARDVRSPRGRHQASPVSDAFQI